VQPVGRIVEVVAEIEAEGAGRKRTALPGQTTGGSS
jgi:hypothetical protein